MKIRHVREQKKFVALAPIMLTAQKISRHSKHFTVRDKSKQTARAPMVIYTADTIEELRNEVHQEVDKMMQTAKMYLETQS